MHTRNGLAVTALASSALVFKSLPVRAQGPELVDGYPLSAAERWTGPGADGGVEGPENRTQPRLRSSVYTLTSAWLAVRATKVFQRLGKELWGVATCGPRPAAGAADGLGGIL